MLSHYEICAFYLAGVETTFSREGVALNVMLHLPREIIDEAAVVPETACFSFGRSLYFIKHGKY